MGLSIFATSLMLVFKRWHICLRLVWIWLLLAAFESYWLKPMFFQNSEATGLQPDSAFLVISAFGIILWIVGCMSIAIGWHRNILLHEVPSAYKAVNTAWPYLPYLLHSFQILLLLGLFSVPLYLILLFGYKALPADVPVMDTENQFALTEIGEQLVISFGIIWFLIQCVAAWITMRIGLVLPAAAIGETISLRESFNRTDPIKLDLVVTALLLAAIESIPELISVLSYFLGFGPGLTDELHVFFTIASAAFFWITLFVGIGVLSIAYEHLETRKN